MTAIILGLKLKSVDHLELKPEYSIELGQYHGCWCPGSLRRQDINSHDIEYAW